MSQQIDSVESVRRDAAVAATAVIMEEFFPHCPNGLAAAIGERVCEVVETAIDAAFAGRMVLQSKPSQN